MKGKEILTYIVKSKMPDREQIRINCHRQPIKKAKPCRYTVAAWSMAILSFCIWVIPLWILPELSRTGLLDRFATVTSQPGLLYECIEQPPESEQYVYTTISPESPQNGEPSGSKIIAAPQIETSESLLPLSNLADFFLYFFHYDGPEAFAFVRTIGIERRIRAARFFDVYEQVSTVEILSTIWQHVGNMPANIQIVQPIRTCTEIWVDADGIAQGAENSNLLREYGVYMLPLRYVDWLEAWVILGDNEVMFEIDDGGLVWSHSAVEGFSKFDGECSTFLADAIRAFTTDANFPAFKAGFGGYVARGVLAEVTIMSVARTTNQWGDAVFQYTLDTGDVATLLSNLQSGDVIIATVHAETQIRYEIGGQYLMLLQFSGGAFYSGAAAQINNDGTITSTTPEIYSCMIRGFNGYQVEQIFEIARRAQAWYEMHVQ